MSDARVGTVAASKRPVKRLVATIFVVALCFCAICVKVLFDARRAAWERAGQVAESLVATLKSDIARNIESYDLSLRAVIDNLAYPETVTVSPELRQLILFDRSASAKHLEAITLLDENGIVRLDSRTPFALPISRADRDYFQFHKNSNIFQLHISEPAIASESGNPVVVISRRLSNPDGSFAGVVAGAMRLSYFQQLFKHASLGPSGNITLSRPDGTILLRWPYSETMPGQGLKSTALATHLALAPSGHFETASVTDGIDRLVTYSRIGDLPLVIGIGQSTTDIYGQWRSYASTIGLLMLLLCATSAALALYLAREMWRRNAAEATLAVLATTDSLTGLSNRRSLTAAFDREWRRAIRDRTPVALVMCDADLFKAYNDLHGHQAGDRLLQAVGTAMNQSIQRSTDVAARYGGDEFAILLPEAAADGGARVAEQVRARFAVVCGEMGIPHAHLSFGVASMVPEAGEEQSSLMSAADQALYRAKELGRDRIEIVQRHRPRPASVVPMRLVG